MVKRSCFRIPDILDLFLSWNSSYVVVIVLFCVNKLVTMDMVSGYRMYNISYTIDWWLVFSKITRYHNSVNGWHISPGLLPGGGRLSRPSDTVWWHKTWAQGMAYCLMAASRYLNLNQCWLTEFFGSQSLQSLNQFHRKCSRVIIAY